MRRNEIYALVMTLVPFAAGFALLQMALVSIMLSICILVLSSMAMGRGKQIALWMSLMHMGLLYVVGYREVGLYAAAAAVTFSCMQCAGEGYEGLKMDRNLYVAAGICYVLCALYLHDTEGVFYVMTIYGPVMYRLFLPTVSQKRLEMSRVTH